MELARGGGSRQMWGGGHEAVGWSLGGGHGGVVMHGRDVVVIVGGGGQWGGHGHQCGHRCSGCRPG
jgi:hypothetical protein